MAETSPVASQPAEPLVYRPISGLAIAGITLAGLYTFFVVISTAVALIQGIPFFLPKWFLVLAVGGAGFSIAAIRQIQNSEGTRAGMKLARAGLWISIFVGLGYTAYDNVTGLALRQQAHDFLADKQPDSGFFPRIREGGERELNAAFLLTLSPSDRQGLDPGKAALLAKIHDTPSAEGARGKLSYFRDHFLVNALRRATKIEPQGVQEWKYENRSYQVLRNYRLELPEAILDVLIPVFSAEGLEAGEQRRWFVALPMVRVVNNEKTPLGERLALARYMSRQNLSLWVMDLNSGKPAQPYQDLTEWERVITKDTLRAAVKDRITEIFTRSDPGRLAPEFSTDDSFSSWKQEGGLLHLSHSFKLRLYGILGANTYVAEGFFHVKSKEPVDLLGALQEAPKWHTPAVEFSFVALAPQDRPGGP